MADYDEKSIAGYAYRFVDAWGEGDVVGLHVGPCLASDLHAAYVAWVKNNGEHAISLARFIRVCNGNLTKWVTAKLEWVLSEDEGSQTEAVVVRPTKGCTFPRGAKESMARYTARSVHVFASAVAAGSFSLPFEPLEFEE